MNELLLSWSTPGDEGCVPVARGVGNKCSVARGETQENKSPHKVTSRPKACSELCQLGDWRGTL